MARSTKKRLLKNCVANSEKMRGTLQRALRVWHLQDAQILARGMQQRGLHRLSPS